MNSLVKKWSEWPVNVKLLGTKCTKALHPLTQTTFVEELNLPAQINIFNWFCQSFPPYGGQVPIGRGGDSMLQYKNANN